MTTEEYEIIEEWITEKIEELLAEDTLDEEEQRRALLSDYKLELDERLCRMPSDAAFWAEVEAMIEDHFDE
jgi:hypothetical protein